MKNLFLTILLMFLLFVMFYSVLLCIDKQAELDCINNLSIDEDVSVCLGE